MKMTPASEPRRSFGMAPRREIMKRNRLFSALIDAGYRYLMGKGGGRCDAGAAQQDAAPARLQPGSPGQQGVGYLRPAARQQGESLPKSTVSRRILTLRPGLLRVHFMATYGQFSSRAPVLQWRPNIRIPFVG